MNNVTDLLRYVVHPSTSSKGWWMAVDTKTHHALAFCKTKEEAQAFCDKRNLAAKKGR